MVPWAKIAGALGQGTVGWISALVGAQNAGMEREKMDGLLSRQETENKAWYNANALSDYTQRADVRNLMRQLRENLSKQNKTAENMAVVTGATPEQMAVQKELSNKVISDVYGNIGVMGQQYKDRVTDRYMDMKNLLNNRRMDMIDAKATSYENLFQNGMKTFGDSFATLASM